MKKGVNQKIKVSVVNTTDQDIEIPGRMLLGNLNLVSSIIPMPVKLQDTTVAEEEETMVEEATDAKICGEVSHVDVSEEGQYTKLKSQIETLKLDHLSKEVQEKVREMLWRKRGAFVADDGEIGEANWT